MTARDYIATKGAGLQKRGAQCELVYIALAVNVITQSRFIIVEYKKNLKSYCNSYCMLKL